MGRSVRFTDDVYIIPEDILAPFFCAFSCCREDPFCRSLGKPAETLEQSARVLQRFIRQNTPHWRRFNDEKSRIIEEMDNILVIKNGELERVSDFLVEGKREAEMEAAMDCDSKELEDDPDLKLSVEEQKRQVKELEKENAHLKIETEVAKKKNKEIATATFLLYESFTQAVFDFKEIQMEKMRLEDINEQYLQCVKTMKGMSKTVKMDIKRERKDRQQLEDCMNQVIDILKESYSKEKLIRKLLKMKFSLSSQVEEFGVLPI